MNVGAIVHRIFGQPVPPAPPPPPEHAPPSDEQVRWAKMQAETLVRRARALDVELDLERAGR
jgi:hypothetical protein